MKGLRQLEAQGESIDEHYMLQYKRMDNVNVSSVYTNVKGQHFLPRQLTSDSHRPSAKVLTANSEIVNKRAKLRHHYLVLSAKVTILMMCDKFTIFKNNRKAELKWQDKSRSILCLK